MINLMIRSYQDADYEQLKALYQHSEWYGGVFDEARDGQERLKNVIANDLQAVLVHETGSKIDGTISIIDDGRVAMLYRFVVPPDMNDVTNELYNAAISTLKERGHSEVLVYSAIDNKVLDQRYLRLGMTRGGDYACFWVGI